MKKTARLTSKPKPNFLRVSITVHRLAHSRDVAVSFIDGRFMSHRTPFCRTRGTAESRLKSWLVDLTGVNRVVLLATAEVLETKRCRA